MTIRIEMPDNELGRRESVVRVHVPDANVYKISIACIVLLLSPSHAWLRSLSSFCRIMGSFRVVRFVIVVPSAL